MRFQTSSTKSRSSRSPAPLPTAVRSSETQRNFASRRLTVSPQSRPTCRMMGVEVHEAEDGMTIYGGSRLKGATLQSYGDHRIAMAFAIAGLFASGSTIIEDAECVRTSYPQFEST